MKGNFYYKYVNNTVIEVFSYILDIIDHYFCVLLSKSN